MNLGEYQKFVNGMKLYPPHYSIIYPTLGMIGEAGEVSEKVKKWLRGDRDLNKQETIKEIGDVLWYIAALADDLGSSIEEVLDANVSKLSDRKDRGVVQGNGDNR